MHIPQSISLCTGSVLNLIASFSVMVFQSLAGQEKKERKKEDRI